AILSAFVIGSCTLTHATKKDTHCIQCMSSPGVHRHFSTPKFDKEPKKTRPPDSLYEAAAEIHNGDKRMRPPQKET
ncbi:hypothetical protein, partial [Acidaminococcus intestini]|uniref:hypothetical protein n=1 Tax=Acidaminococcus intestini TaxID=187327 RepID=UPI003AF0709C